MHVILRCSGIGNMPNKKPPLKGGWCPEQESNLHTLWAADFESAASTNSAIWAYAVPALSERGAILHYPSILSKIRCKYFFL